MKCTCSIKTHNTHMSIQSKYTDVNIIPLAWASSQTPVIGHCAHMLMWLAVTVSAVHRAVMWTQKSSCSYHRYEYRCYYLTLFSLLSAVISFVRSFWKSWWHLLGFIIWANSELLNALNLPNDDDLAAQKQVIFFIYFPCCVCSHSVKADLHFCVERMDVVRHRLCAVADLRGFQKL